MKILKRLALVIALFSALICVCAAAGCSKNDGYLSTPENLVISDSVLTWDSVKGAEYYEVEVGGEIYKTTECSYNLFGLFAAEGDYAVYVAACAGGENYSDWAQTTYSIVNCGKFKYTLSSDGTYYTVVGKDSTVSGTLVIPSEYNGKPVKAISGFYYYSNITEVILPDTVTSITGVFSGFVSLKRMVWSANVSVQYDTYNELLNLEQFIIPDGGKKNLKVYFEYYMGSSGVSNFPKLTKINLPSTVETVNFSGCANLEEITISADNPYLKLDSGCVVNNSLVIESGLSSATIPDYATGIKRGAFAWKKIEQITIPDSMEEIESSAFFKCKQLTSVIFEDTEGWYVGAEDSDGDLESLTAVPAEALADPATAAKYLTEDYVGYYWYHL